MAVYQEEEDLATGALDNLEGKTDYFTGPIKARYGVNGQKPDGQWKANGSCWHTESEES